MESNEEIKEFGVEAALAYAKNIINTVHDPVIILYEDLKVALASRYFYEVFEVNPQETEGQYIYDLGNHQWDIPKFRQLLEEILPKMTSFDDFEIEHDFPHIGKRIMLLNACRIYLNVDPTKLIIITIKDITQRKKITELNEKIMELEARLNKFILDDQSWDVF